MTWLDPRRVAMLEEMGVSVWTRPVAPTVAEGPDAVLGGDLQTGHGQAGYPAGQGHATGVQRLHEAGPPAASPGAAGPVPEMDWPALREAVAACRACGLCETRRQTVFGTGSTQAGWMVVGEAPGEQEDRQGEPFVGASGQLLDVMLAAMGVSRQAAAGEANSRVPGTRADVFIANVLKCRPPDNRNPQPAEMAQCLPFLRRQVALVRPRVILAMGRFAIQALLDTNEPVGRLRGRVHQLDGVPVIVTYHPSYLLRQPSDKGKAWEDLCLAAAVAARATDAA